jgi:hypothetical protein
MKAELAETLAALGEKDDPPPEKRRRGRGR